MNCTRKCERAVASGARVLLGGRMIPGPGYFYEPTVLADLPRQSAVFHEELFGPVAMLFRVADADAAIDLANDSPFGLGSSVWTRDRSEQDRFIDEIETGQVYRQCDGRLRPAVAVRRHKALRLRP